MLIAVVLASLSSFVVHVLTVEWLPTWIGNQMQGISIQPSWDVRYVAAFTSIEYGLSALALYLLCREKLMTLGLCKAYVIFAALLTAIHGALIRQPLMDYLVGNPIHVVMVQNGFKWIIWALMSFFIVFGFELIFHKKPRQ